VFRINQDGTGFTNLYSFPPYNSGNIAGSNPALVLVLAGNNLYGNTLFGGSGSQGVIFMVKADGSGYSTLYTFTATSGTPATNVDGGQPDDGGVILSGTTIFGTTTAGGSVGGGTIFAIQTNGMGFTNLHNFTGGVGGVSSHSRLALSGDTLYGTTSQGGAYTEGMVFSIKTNGLGFTNLYSFPPNFTSGNGVGADPNGALVISGNTLYGETQVGGTGNGGGSGVIFAIHTDGTGFTNLHNFNFSSDGAYPICGVTLSGGVLYGTTPQGGAGSQGTVFSIGTNGGFTNLYSFSATSGSKSTNAGGAGPVNLPLIANNCVYGMAAKGGTNGNGTIFKILLPGPTLGINLGSGGNAILSWSTNATGFTLQATTNLQGNWTNYTGSPAIIKGQYEVTNPIQGDANFFRLTN
jgi:uncharacterized repeat protein (TIGR03803 family)